MKIKYIILSLTALEVLTHFSYSSGACFNWFNCKGLSYTYLCVHSSDSEIVPDMSLKWRSISMWFCSVNSQDEAA